MAVNAGVKVNLPSYGPLNINCNRGEPEPGPPFVPRSVALLAPTSSRTHSLNARVYLCLSGSRATWLPLILYLNLRLLSPLFALSTQAVLTTFNRRVGALTESNDTGPEGVQTTASTTMWILLWYVSLLPT